MAVLAHGVSCVVIMQPGMLKALVTPHRTVTATITYNGSTIDTKLKLGK